MMSSWCFGFAKVMTKANHSTGNVITSYKHVIGIWMMKMNRQHVFRQSIWIISLNVYTVHSVHMCFAWLQTKYTYVTLPIIPLKYPNKLLKDVSYGKIRHQQYCHTAKKVPSFDAENTEVLFSSLNGKEDNAIGVDCVHTKYTRR